LKEKTRYKFIDYLRGWALLVMIEVHVFNSMLIPAIKTEGWFYVLNFINGLVAPSFLFISGYAFYISSDRKLDELRKYRSAFWRKIGRIVVILLAGYSLHFPFRSIFVLRQNIFYLHWGQYVIVDILQCIAIGLLFLFVLRLIIKSTKLYDIIIFVSGLAVVILSPFVNHIDFSRNIPLFFADYINNVNGSLFPLFPWLGFMFLGATACKFFLDAKRNGTEKKYINSLAAIGIILLLVGHLFPLDFIAPGIRYINPNPLFFFLRLGYVFLLLVICWYYEQVAKPGKSFILDVSRESLLIYWLHLVLIYGMFWEGKSLYSAIDHGFNVIDCILMTIVLSILMIIVAKIWGKLKTKIKVFQKP
jgi:uncharacterized membrane protein